MWQGFPEGRFHSNASYSEKSSERDWFFHGSGSCPSWDPRPGGGPDEQFVEKICRDWGVPFRSRHYPVPELSGKWKLGEEETGRIVRKQAFQEEKKRLGFSGEQSEKNGQFRIALAHNRNDLAETMLHHLARGTGIRGLSGIQAVNGEIIRPVLCLERKEIVNYLKERGISYITDSSNLSDDYTRNRIRNHVLPAMEQKINAKSGGAYGRNRTGSGRSRFVSSEKGKGASGKLPERKWLSSG